MVLLGLRSRAASLLPPTPPGAAVPCGSRGSLGVSVLQASWVVASLSQVGALRGRRGRGCRPRTPRPSSPLCPPQEAWKHAIQKAKHMPDPWAEFHLEDVPTECATRHRSVARQAVPCGPGPPGVLVGGCPTSPRSHGAPSALRDRGEGDGWGVLTASAPGRFARWSQKRL